MNQRESRYGKVAKIAHRLTRQALPKYSHAKSPHHFELPQLAANGNLGASASKTSSAGNDTVTITLTNNNATNVAFFVRAEVTAGNNGLEVLPVTYTDNYITLWPGESIIITAKYATADLGGQSAYLRVRGYNISTVNIPIP